MDSVIAPVGASVTLGGQTYQVKPVKFKRVFKLKRLIVSIVKELDGISMNALFATFAGTAEPDAQKAHERNAKAVAALDQLLELILSQVGELFTVAIPKLDAAIFSEEADDEASPDVQEMWAAFMVILEVNHLQFIKNQTAAFVESLRTTETPPQSGTQTTMPSPQSPSSTDSLQAQLDNLPFPS